MPDTISTPALAAILKVPLTNIQAWQNRGYLRRGGNWDFPSSIAVGMLARTMANRQTGREAGAKAVGMAKAVGELLDQAAKDTPDEEWLGCDRLLSFTARYPSGAVRDHLARSEHEATTIAQVLIETGATAIEMTDATSVFRSVTEAFIKIAAKRREKIPA